MKPSRIALGWLVVAAVAPEIMAQVTYEQNGGVTYQVTRSPKSIPVTEMRTEQHTTYAPQTRTEYQSYQQTYVTPVTQYQWVMRQRGQWNPFGRPYWATELQPVTTWQTSQGTVQVPQTRTDWVRNEVTRQVPVVTYQTVVDEHKVAVSAAPTGALGGTAIASRPESYGGQQMKSDPPRSGGTYR
jgi:hypothetical protein